MTTQLTEEQKKGASRGCLWMVIALVALVVLGVTQCGGSDDGVSESGARTHARDICRDATKQQMKSPSTAKFTDEDVVLGSTTDAGYNFAVKGVVEAENSFGGTVGYDFTCTAYVPKKGGETTGRSRITER